MREGAITTSEAGQLMWSANPVLGKKKSSVSADLFGGGLQWARQKSKRCEGNISMSKSALKKKMWKTYCASRDLWSTNMSTGMHRLVFWDTWFLQSLFFLLAIFPNSTCTLRWLIGIVSSHHFFSTSNTAKTRIQTCIILKMFVLFRKNVCFISEEKN